MNRYRVFWALVCSAVFFMSANAQEMVSSIEPVKLMISNAFTSTLLFPYAIKKASWCSPHFAVQQTKEVANMLEIKSSIADFAPSNLSVVTSDGHFYSFMIYYDPEPYHLNYRLQKDTGIKKATVAFTASSYNEEQLQQWADSAMVARSFMRRRMKSKLLRVQLAGIYFSEGLTWIKFRIDHRHRVAMTIDHANAKMYSSDKLRSAIATSRPIELIHPLSPVTIHKEKQTVVIAVPAALTQRQQMMQISLRDEKGLSQIDLRITPRQLLRARPLLTY